MLAGALAFSYSSLDSYVTPTIAEARTVTSRTLKLDYLYPTSGLNSRDQNDRILVSIYSDALETVVQCGVYEFSPLSFLAFNGLEIPCVN